MKNIVKTVLISALALVLLSGCVVYEPRPVYACPVYYGPDVVVVHSYGYGYYHGYYYRR
jgi:hypothetical protein